MAQASPEQVMALGLAGWALASQILVELSTRKLISEDVQREIIDGALATLERGSVASPHPSYRPARMILESLQKSGLLDPESP